MNEKKKRVTGASGREVTLKAMHMILCITFLFFILPLFLFSLSHFGYSRSWRGSVQSLHMASKTDSMQVATVGSNNPSTDVLEMPSEDFVSLQLQPLQDDTWIRQEQIVHMENLVDTEGGERVKKEILKDFMEEKVRQGTYRMDPILEGMMYQENLMREYRKNQHSEDAAKAQSYRQQLMDEHRRARAIRDAEM